MEKVVATRERETIVFFPMQHTGKGIVFVTAKTVAKNNF